MNHTLSLIELVAHWLALFDAEPKTCEHGESEEHYTHIVRNYSDDMILCHGPDDQ